MTSDTLVKFKDKWGKPLMHRFEMSIIAATIFFFTFSTMGLAAEVTSPGTPITVKIDYADGGKRGQRHLSNMLSALKKNGCHCTLYNASTHDSAQLLFDSRPISTAKIDLQGYSLIARARTLAGELKVRGAILVHASTGITDLKSLQGERIAFVGRESLIGYHLPLQLLHDAGIEEQMDMFFYVDNHIGTMSMLLHSDVYVAVTAEPLAQRWAKYNELSIVAITNAVETGGWWIRRGISVEEQQRCQIALSKLKRSSHKALPAWVNGFTTLHSELHK